MNNDLIAILSNLSTEELREANSFVVELLNNKRAQRNLGQKARLSVGMEVELDHDDHRGDKYVVDKINRTRAVISKKDDTSPDYMKKRITAPFSMIIVPD
jgi:hypothetical protein